MSGDMKESQRRKSFESPLLALLGGKLSRRTVLRSTAAGLGGLLLGGGKAFAKGTLPGTRVDPYVLPSLNGVDITSILTTGDLAAGNNYRMVGIPDGLGAYTGP